jgi:predicted nucleotidyltransferase
LKGDKGNDVSNDMANDVASKTGLDLQLLHQVSAVLGRYPQVRSAVIYGSRARGDFRQYSDCDIALFGDFSEQVTADVAEALSELETVVTFDVVHFEHLANEALRRNIELDGIRLL